MAPHNIFAAILAQLQHGYALWAPEPSGYDEVKVGDVGYLWRGAFHRLFNATLPADHPSNCVLGVPDGFIPLVVPDGSLYRIDKFFDPGALHSSNVSRIEFGASAEG
jgi:hypothetical protein